jgi:hypothetical protein
MRIILFNVDVATKYGIDVAIFHQTIIQEIGLYSGIYYEGENFEFIKTIDNEMWIKLSKDRLKSMFPFWSYSQSKRTIAKVIDLGLLKFENKSDHPFDRTRWVSAGDIS